MKKCFYCNKCCEHVIGISRLCYYCFLKTCYSCGIRINLYQCICKDCKTNILYKCKRSYGECFICCFNNIKYGCDILHHCVIPIKNKYMNINIL